MGESDDGEVMDIDDGGGDGGLGRGLDGWR